MKQHLTKGGTVYINLLDVDPTRQADRDQFAAVYAALSYVVRKRIENAFYIAHWHQLVERKHPPVVEKQDNINHLRVDINDIIDNANVIKHLIEPTEV